MFIRKDDATYLEIPSYHTNLCNFITLLKIRLCYVYFLKENMLLYFISRNFKLSALHL